MESTDPLGDDPRSPELSASPLEMLEALEDPMELMELELVLNLPCWRPSLDESRAAFLPRTLDTLWTGAKRPCLGLHWKYLEEEA